MLFPGSFNLLLTQYNPKAFEQVSKDQLEPTYTFKISVFPTSRTSTCSGFSFSLFTLSHLTTAVRQRFKTSAASLWGFG